MWYSTGRTENTGRIRGLSKDGDRWWEFQAFSCWLTPWRCGPKWPEGGRRWAEIWARDQRIGSRGIVSLLASGVRGPDGNNWERSGAGAAGCLFEEIKMTRSGLWALWEGGARSHEGSLDLRDLWENSIYSGIYFSLFNSGLYFLGIPRQNSKSLRVMISCKQPKDQKWPHSWSTTTQVASFWMAAESRLPDGDPHNCGEKVFVGPGPILFTRTIRWLTLWVYTARLAEDIIAALEPSRIRARLSRSGSNPRISTRMWSNLASFI
jgi:hypothetical protein